MRERSLQGPRQPPCDTAVPIISEHPSLQQPGKNDRLGTRPAALLSMLSMLEAKRASLTNYLVVGLGPSLHSISAPALNASTIVPFGRIAGEGFVCAQ